MLVEYSLAAYSRVGGACSREEEKEKEKEEKGESAEERKPGNTSPLSPQ